MILNYELYLWNHDEILLIVKLSRTLGSTYFKLNINLEKKQKDPLIGNPLY